MLALSMFRTRIEGRVLFATLDAPPLNMIGPEVVHDLVDLVQYVENRDNDVAVVVFDSANPEFFSAHVDMTQVPALAREVQRVEPDAGSRAVPAHQHARAGDDHFHRRAGAWRGQ
jgi:enoyl-CoA hydratase/carnithine racemase